LKHLPHTLPTSNFNVQEEQFITTEIAKLLSKGIITKSNHEPGEYISPIFLTPKSDGDFRLILNLKNLNQYMPYIHFKMDTAEKVIRLIKKDCYMAKKDAYYSVKIKEEHQKLLQFIFKGVLYHFTCLPNGLCSGPRKFTKVLKPPLAFLRSQEHILVSAYIDDLITLEDTFEGCFSNVRKMILLLESLGFIIHPGKSCFKPTKEIEYLGLIIDSTKMKVFLTPRKKIENY